VAVVVLVHSATGGVGLWASEIAARRGGVVVGVVGHAHKIPVFQERILPLCPAAQCFVRSSNPQQFAKDLQDAVVRARLLHHSQQQQQQQEHQEANKEDVDLSSLCGFRYESAHDLVERGWGVDYVMESYGGPYFMPSLDLINPGGSLATFGSTTYNGRGNNNRNRIAFLPLLWKYLTRPRIDPGCLTTRNIRVGGFNLIFLTQNEKELRNALENCIQCLSSNSSHADHDDDNDDEHAKDDDDDPLARVTPPVVGHVFEFDTQAVEALQTLRSGKTVGKVVLTNPNNPLLQQQ